MGGKKLPGGHSNRSVRFFKRGLLLFEPRNAFKIGKLILKKCIIWANGKAPRKSAVLYLKKVGYDTLICADGGANSARRYNIIPDVIVGDFDSIERKTISFFKNKSKIIHVKSQYSTDVEKCLSYAIKKKFTEAVLIGVTGDRLDHTFCNLGIVLKFFYKIKLNIAAENSFLSAFTGNIALQTIDGETISLYGLDSKTKIISEGLKYPLKNISLPFGEKESTSNVALNNIVKLKIKGGKIFVIRDFNLLKKNGLI